jgi:beta-phosphoglucomutase
MNWIHEYQLFLFDFDGLLVNTEELHFLAYKRMCAARGLDLDWDFNRYCQAAHYDAHLLRDHLYTHFSNLKLQEPNWDVLYAEKKQAICDLLQEGVHLMPGVTHLLQALQTANIKRCVVTHSPTELVNLVRKQNPILDTIPFWVTREQYSQPKPNPECYLKAIDLLAKPHERVIGFEDTPRGLNALLGTRAKPVLICQAEYPEIPAFVQAGVAHFPTFDALINRKEAI